MRQTAITRQEFISNLNIKINEIWEEFFTYDRDKRAIKLKDEFQYELYLAQLNTLIDEYTYTIICEYHPLKPTIKTPLQDRLTNGATSIEKYKQVRDQLILKLHHQSLTKKSIKEVTTIFNEVGAIVFSLIDEMPALQLDLPNNVKAQISHEDIALTMAQKKYYWETSPKRFEWRLKLNSVTQTIIEHLQPNRIKGTKLRIGPGLANPTQVEIGNLVVNTCAATPSFHMKREKLKPHSDLNLKQWMAHINNSRSPVHSDEQKDQDQDQGQGQDSGPQGLNPTVFMTFLSPALPPISCGICCCKKKGPILEARILSTQQQSIETNNSQRNSISITGINIPYDSFRLTPFAPTPNYQAILQLLDSESSSLQEEKKTAFNSIYEKLVQATAYPIYYAKTIPLLIFILCNLLNIPVKHNCKSNKDRGANFILTIFALAIIATLDPTTNVEEKETNDNVLEKCINYLASGGNTLLAINQALKTKRRELILDNTAATLSLHLGIAPKQEDIEYITWGYACLIFSSWLCCCPCALYEAPQKMHIAHVLRCLSSIKTALYPDNFSKTLEEKGIIQYPNLNKATAPAPAPQYHEMKR